MKLTSTQIQGLYAFTRQHFVEYYDLQTELVDHLANDIESIWQEQPKLPFNEARDLSFKKFGVFGFMEVIEEYQKGMGKKYSSYLWGHLKQWFALPQLLVTLCIVMCFYLLFSTSYASYFFIGIFFVFVIWCFYKGISLNRGYKKRKKHSNKKWMLESIIFEQASVFGLILLSQTLNLFNLSKEMFSSTTIIIIAAIVFTLTIICSYICLVLLPNEAESLLEKTYPEYSL